MLLEQFRQNPHDTALVQQIQANSADIGYGLLLKKYTDNVANATPEMIDKAANDTVPTSWPLFYTFRIMVGLGFSFFLLFALATAFSAGKRSSFESKTWLLKWSLW